jgi:hypothetical protein
VLPKKGSKTDEIDRQIKINRILKYQESKFFNDIVKNQLSMNHTYETLSKKNTQQLDSILNRIRVAIDTDALSIFYDNLAGSGALATENIITGLGYDITGFSTNLLKNNQFFICFEKFKIESDLPTIPIGFQLAQIVISTAVITHLENKSRQIPNV